MRPEELLVNPSLYVPTGDRMTDLIMAAFAGLRVQDYAGEIEPSTPELAWAHAVLSGGPMPALITTHKLGYELAHLVFYATDFGRRPVESASVVQQILALVDAETDPDLLCEYGVALKCLTAPVPQKVIDAACMEPLHQHHADVIALFEAR